MEGHAPSCPIIEAVRPDPYYSAAATPRLLNRKGTDLLIRPLPAYELLLALVLGNQCPDWFCETTSLSLKIGRNNAITMPPTITPRKTISIGSINEVSASSIASISSSQKSAIFSSIVSILPVASPAATIRSIIGGKIVFFDSATERLSPFSTSPLTPLMLISTTWLPDAPPTISSTSRIGTPLRISCANVRANRDMQIL